MGRLARWDTLRLATRTSAWVRRVQYGGPQLMPAKVRLLRAGGDPWAIPLPLKRHHVPAADHPAHGPTTRRVRTDVSGATVATADLRTYSTLPTQDYGPGSSLPISR